MTETARMEMVRVVVERGHDDYVHGCIALGGDPQTILKWVYEFPQIVGVTR